MRRLGKRDCNVLKKEIATTLYAFHHGRQRSITSKRLGQRLNLGRANATPVRVAIAELRMEGHPIASTNSAPKGYYIPANVEEANECLRHLRSRVKKICQAAAGVSKGLQARYGSQMKLGFDYQEQHAPRDTRDHRLGEIPPMHFDRQGGLR